MFYILGYRQITRRVVLFSSTMLFKILSSSDVDNLLKRHIWTSLLLFTVWISMLEINDQHMNGMGSDSDEMVWKQYKLKSTRYMFQLHISIDLD